MAQNFDPVRGREDVAEDVPQAGDGVEAGVPAAKFLGPDSPAASTGRPLAAHPRAGLQQYEILQSGRLDDTEGAGPVARSYIEQRPGALRNFRNDNLVDSIKVCAPAFRQSRKLRCDLIVGLDWFEKSPVAGPLRHHFRNEFSRKLLPFIHFLSASYRSSAFWGRA